MTVAVTEQGQLTATEALAEIVTLDKRLVKKREAVFPYLARQQAVVDPLIKEGGSVAHIESERQAIRDLEMRKVALRIAIQKMNLVETITVFGVTRTIAEWLAWRKEVLPHQKSFLNGMRLTIEKNRVQQQAKGLAVVSIDQSENARREDWVVNLKEKELLAEIEQLENIEGTLDGQLSYKNATVPLTL